MVPLYRAYAVDDDLLLDVVYAPVDGGGDDDGGATAGVDVHYDVAVVDAVLLAVVLDVDL